MQSVSLGLVCVWWLPYCPQTKNSENKMRQHRYLDPIWSFPIGPLRWSELLFSEDFAMVMNERTSRLSSLDKNICNSPGMAICPGHLMKGWLLVPLRDILRWPFIQVCHYKFDMLERIYFFGLRRILQRYHNNVTIDQQKPRSMQENVTIMKLWICKIDKYAKSIYASRINRQ